MIIIYYWGLSGAELMQRKDNENHKFRINEFIKTSFSSSQKTWIFVGSPILLQGLKGSTKRPQCLLILFLTSKQNKKFLKNIFIARDKNWMFFRALKITRNKKVSVF